MKNYDEEYSKYFNPIKPGEYTTANDEAEKIKKVTIYEELPCFNFSTTSCSNK